MLADAYSSLTKTIGTWLTNTSRKIPPPTAVKTPAEIMARKFRPKSEYAKVAPIMVNTPKPIASNFKKNIPVLLEFRK